MTNTQLAKRSNEIQKVLKGDLFKLKISKLAPKGLDADRFISAGIAELMTNDKLLQCEPKSIYLALAECAKFGLIPSCTLGKAYLIPFANQCKFILGYKGMLELIYRHPKISSVQAQEVYKNDFFEVEEDIIRHKKSMEAPKIVAVTDKRFGISQMVDPSEIAAVYVRVRNTDGQKINDHFVKWEIDMARQRSRSPNSPAWKYFYAAMAKKALLRKMFAYLPHTAEMEAAIQREYDVTNSGTDLGVDDFIDDKQKDTRSKSEKVADIIEGEKVTPPVSDDEAVENFLKEETES